MVQVDLNGDGILDLVTVCPFDDFISVSMGRGDGTFRPPVFFPAGASPYNLAIGDVNDDGIPDVVVTDIGSDSIGVLLGTRGGSFQPIQSYLLYAGSGPRWLAMGDFNSDGYLDLAVPDINSNNVSILINGADWGPHASARPLAPEGPLAARSLPPALTLGLPEVDTGSGNVGWSQVGQGLVSPFAISCSIDQAFHVSSVRGGGTRAADPLCLSEGGDIDSAALEPGGLA
jgi:hypothetical protein